MLGTEQCIRREAHVGWHGRKGECEVVAEVVVLQEGGCPVSEVVLWLWGGTSSSAEGAGRLAENHQIYRDKDSEDTSGAGSASPYVPTLYTTPISRCSDPERDARSEQSHLASNIHTERFHSAGDRVFTSNQRTQRKAYLRRNIPRSVSLIRSLRANSFHTYLVFRQTFMTMAT